MTKTCENCGSEFGPSLWGGRLEPAHRFAIRRFCGRACSRAAAFGYRVDATPLERFMRKVSEDGSGCWLWTASTNGKYPKFYVGRVDGKTKLAFAHRWSYEHFIGPIPRGLEIDHLCRVKLCVNPAHLEAVTSSENKMRIPADLRKRPNLYEIHAARREKRGAA